MPHVYASSGPVRVRSHEHLPASHRFVQPYLYLATYPPGNHALSKLELTTDVHLHIRAQQNMLLINSFIGAMDEVSIDCFAHHTSGCRLCAPNHENLFTRDMTSDLQAPDRCQPVRESRITAHSMHLGEVEYMYYVAESKQVHVMEWNVTLAGWQEMDPGHPQYWAVLQHAKAAAKAGRK
jgi:hypothetical protein